MTAKVRIDISAGTLEVEGTEEFVRELYQDFRDKVTPTLGSTKPRADSNRPPAQIVQSGNGAELAARKSRTERKSGASSLRARTPVLVKDLDLAAKGSRPSLKDFVARYRKLKNSQEQNSFFAYYLAREANISPITMDHIYTCYKPVGFRVPKVMTQSLWDTARNKGTIEVVTLDDIRLTTAGENWVEHDLDKADQKAATI